MPEAWIVEWETDGYLGYAISFGSHNLEIVSNFKEWWKPENERSWGKLTNVLVMSRADEYQIVEIQEKKHESA